MATARNEVEKQKLMTGLFNDRESAESAYNALSSRGYSEKDINLVMSDDTRKKHFSGPGAQETELGNKAAKGAGVGGAVGGTVVGIAAAVAAIGSNLVIPGLGLVIAGPLAAGLAGAGAGAGAGWAPFSASTSARRALMTSWPCRGSCSRPSRPRSA